MNIIIQYIVSLTINIFFLVFIGFFMKFSWFHFRARFMKNPAVINQVLGNNKVISALVNIENGKAVIGNKTFIIKEEYAVFVQRLPYYHYFGESAEPSFFDQFTEPINPEYLTDLLVAMKLSGTIGWIDKLMKMKWILISFVVTAIGVGYLVYKMNDLTKAVATLNFAVQSLKSAQLVG